MWPWVQNSGTTPVPAELVAVTPWSYLYLCYMLLMPHLITPSLHLKPSVPCSNKVPLPQNEPPCIPPVKTEPPWLSFCLFVWPKPAPFCALPAS